MAFYLRVLSALIQKYPLKHYCDSWNENVAKFIKITLQGESISLKDLIGEPSESIAEKFGMLGSVNTTTGVYSGIKQCMEKMEELGEAQT